MNYFAQKKSYYRQLLINPLSRDAQLLYNYLLDKDNELFWKERFSVTNSEIMIFTGISISALQRARNELKTKGYIDYEKRSGNNAGFYKIIDFVIQIEQQNGQQNEQEDEQQNGQQNGHIHNIEQKTIYFIFLLNKIRAQYPGQKNEITKNIACKFAKQQPEWFKLTKKEQDELIEQI